ncbi:hypothetical protein BD311DRAFT_752604 [Dichomitus squalens]|uniref:Uncharacterized protein n=1 Tax=Dichomitus squalens TaxID=114155 RepID=A0A4Q9MU93_9APHY|nr:hypothetical protein BD311DRAFT_752604 [Dichomitus squalens]
MKRVERGSGLRIFVPTDAYLYEEYKSGALKNPPEADMKAIQDFINVANSLLPEAMRDEAALKIEDMHFEVHHQVSLWQPTYKRVERSSASPSPTGAHGYLATDGSTS